MNFYYASFVFLLFPVTCLTAQPDTILLEDITISVTSFEQRLSEATGSLSIIQPVTGDNAHTINIADQLNTAPGIYMSSGTHTTNRLTIRGVGSRSPYSSNRIRAYIEEIPLTGGDGITSVEDVDISGLSRMEIVKGPASAMYGSGLGGVIKFKALYPVANGFSYNLSAGAGSYNSQKYVAQTGWKKGNSAITAGYARVSTDGFRENNQYNRDQLFIHGKTGSEKNRYTFHLLATNLYAQIPSSLNETHFINSPSMAAANWLAIEGHKKYAKATGGASWNHKITDKWANHLVLFSTWQDPYESRPFNILDEKSFLAGIRNFIQYEGVKIKAQTGIELFSESYEWKILETIGGDAGALQLHNSEIRRSGNLFSHLRWNPAERLNIEAGVNINLLEYRIATIYHVDGTDQSGSYSYQPVVSPRVGMNYNILQNHSFHASAGHGFSAPSLEETLLPEGLVNKELEPETGWNFDAGVRGWFWEKRWYYDASFYTILMKNMLVTKRIAEDIFSGINAGAATLSGIELYNRILLSDPAPGRNWKNSFLLTVFLNKNWFTEFIDDGNDYTGNRLPAIPAQMVMAGLYSEYNKKLTLQAELRYLGSQFLNDSNSENYNGHLLTNIRASYKIEMEKMPFSLNLSGGVNNIFNTAHASMILVNAPSFGPAAPRYYYPGMPRNFFVSLSIER